MTVEPVRSDMARCAGGGIIRSSVAIRYQLGVNGGFRPRLTAWIRDLVQDEIDAGHYSAPEDPQLLADGIVTIGERFLHHGGDPDVSPDPTSAGRMIALLLREPCDKPPGAATPKRPSTHVS
jgi:hypothetical protein